MEVKNIAFIVAKVYKFCDNRLKNKKKRLFLTYFSFEEFFFAIFVPNNLKEHEK